LSVTPSAAGPVEVGDQVRLVAERRDAGGRVAVGAAVSWTSSDPRVATVDADGVVTARGFGTADITAEAGGISATVQFSVASPDRAALEAFYHATDGPSWTNSTGWLTDAPVDDWHGVTADSAGRVVGLHLQSNRLAGAIPSELGGLASLEQLYLQRNQLSGNIPVELGGLASLQWLLLNHNALTGAVPADLGDLASLQGLLINNNSDLAGALPLALSSLSALSLFRYEGTGLCVPADAAFRAWLNAIRTHSGTGVDCDDSASSDATLSALSLSGVTLNPAFASATTSYTASVGNDVAQTTVAATASSSAATMTIVPSDADANTAGHQVDLAVGSNRITVSVTAEDGTGMEYVVTVTRQADSAPTSDRDILVAFYHATGGPNWLDNTNWLTDAPLGEWYGVDTDASGRAVTLDLSGYYDGSARQYVPHGLTGDIPAELGELASLETLDLSVNQLAGEIPPELGGLASLQVLRLGVNQLTGEIPAELGTHLPV